MEKEHKGARSGVGKVFGCFGGVRRVRGGWRAVLEGLENRVMLTTAAFFEGVMYPTQTAPEDIVAADFNGDGKKDIAFAENTLVSVMLNRGNGTFVQGATFEVVGLLSLSLTHGDFNGDGKEDIAVASQNILRVFLNLGNGKFGPGVISGSWGGGAITTGDFNNDGKLDLAVADGSFQTVNIFLNNGDGTFAEVPYMMPAGSRAVNIKAVDMNGDGWTDLVTAGANMSIDVSLNDKAGGFQRTEYSLGGQDYLRLLTVGDFNGDGKVDVAVGRPGIDFVSVFMNNGDGTLGPKVDYWEPLLRGMTTGDVNGDGKTDLVVTELWDKVGVRLNDGRGGFGAERIFYAPDGVPWQMAVADFNGDGAGDIAMGITVTQTPKLMVMLNRDTFGATTSVSLTQSSGDSALHQAVTFTASVTPANGGLVTGHVRFLMDGVLWAVEPVRDGMASFETSSMDVTHGSPDLIGHSVVAVYDGDSVLAGSNSERVRHDVSDTVLGNSYVPMGWVDVVNGLTVKGWAMDKDTAVGPVEVEVDVDGKYAGTTVANEVRADVGRLFGSALHGFTFSMPTLSWGNHLVQVYAVDTSTGMRQLLLGREIDATFVPIGWVDGVNGQTLTGWAFDGNAGSLPVQVAYAVDGGVRKVVTASAARRDLAAVVGSAGHGFSIPLTGLPAGSHKVEVWAIDPFTMVPWLIGVKGFVSL